MNRTSEISVRPWVIFQIGVLYHRVYKECGKIFREKSFPLEMDQLPVVLKLYYEGGASQQEISLSSQRDKASVNRTVSFLLKKGLVKVVQDVADKRKTLVELTATGKKLARQADVMLEEFNEVLSSVLTKEERKQFHSLMLKLIDTKIFT
jgi:DNA-binding MarR family transcriptional regulator